MRQAGHKVKRPISMESLESRCYLSGDGIGPLVSVRLEATDLAGQPIQSISAGQEFLLHALADDLREGEPFPGVFGVYADVWYRPELIGVDAGLTKHDVDFDELFLNCRSVDASLPGVISEIGSCSSQMTPTGEEEVSLWTVKVRAVAPGLAQFVLDAADKFGNDVLLYGLNERVAPSRVEFTGASIQITAADGTIAAENDFPVIVPDETPTQPVIPDPDSIATTPPVIESPIAVQPAPSQLPATEPGPGAQTPAGNVGALVRIRLEATDLSGRPIDSIAEGEEFLLRAYVDDLRSDQPSTGVFAAYADVWYGSELIDVATEAARDVAEFSAPFVDGRRGTVSPGIIDEIGAFAGQQIPTGAAELPIWSLKFTAKTAGLARFVLDPADEIGHDVLLYGLNEAVNPLKIEFIGDDLQIVPSDGSMHDDNENSAAITGFAPAVDRPATILKLIDATDSVTTNARRLQSGDRRAAAVDVVMEFASTGVPRRPGRVASDNGLLSPIE